MFIAISKSFFVFGKSNVTAVFYIYSRTEIQNFLQISKTQKNLEYCRQGVRGRHVD